MKKLPEITLAFWIMKICATTLGETAGDMFSMTINIGYGISSMMLISFFIITLMFQLFSKQYRPAVYWSVILATSTAGTTVSDYIDRSLQLGYAKGALLLVTLLFIILLVWKKVENNLSVESVTTRRAEIFYWTAILVSNTLGTALGDYLADDSGLGFLGGAILISSLIAGIVLLYYFTKISRVVLFWAAFILTRPFGATFGDLLTKPVEKGGFDLGTIGSSSVLFTLLLVLVIIQILNNDSKTGQLS
ncbi:COG4705 family protein [Flavobacterium sp. C4GT6]|uniref:COG4705 family protein n=1 Tax=Flavobacterium sp. C4GT6 TaxID=3103818 RepID=UPI002ED081FF